MKLENHLYLIKREDGRYLLVKPIYDLDDKLSYWEDQDGIAFTFYEDDDIIGSVERIEERNHVRQARAKNTKEIKYDFTN